MLFLGFGNLGIAKQTYEIQQAGENYGTQQNL